jgi:uncharacterized protein YdhG (YjbR/CyaY superfamily)
MKAKTIDEYLAALSDDKRTALEKLRKVIKAAAPKAEECISYQLPAFRLDGRMLVAFGATANHCAFYPMSSSTVAAHQDDLKDYDTSKGTIRFQSDHPLPAALVRKLVKRGLQRTPISRRSGSGVGRPRWWEMDEERMDELARDPRFIPGIYNYCDRWCERCAFTARCLNYAMGQEMEADASQSRDSENEAFWDKLHETFESTMEETEDPAEEMDFDLDEEELQESIREQEEIHDAARSSPAVGSP